MKHLMAIAVLLALAGCATKWDWHAVGQSLLESLCDSFGNCSVPCPSGDTSGACQ